MAKFSIRITKASSPDYWYASRIGEVFEVRGARPEADLLTHWFIITHPEKFLNGAGALWDDCEIVAPPDSLAVDLSLKLATAQIEKEALEVKLEIACHALRAVLEQMPSVADSLKRIESK